MRARFILLFLLLWSVLTPEAFGEAQGSSFKENSTKETSDVLTALLESLPLRYLIREDPASQPLSPSERQKQRRSYYIYLMKAQGILARQRLMLRSFPLPSLTIPEKLSGMTVDDFSRYFFQYFTNAFSEIESVIASLESPHLYLRPLLELARHLYAAAIEASGQKSNPTESIRRGVPEDLLQDWISVWRFNRRQLDHCPLTAEGQSVIKCVARMVQHGINLAQQLNNQRTRKGISLDDLNFMKKCIQKLIDADDERSSNSEKH